MRLCSSRTSSSKPSAWVSRARREGQRHLVNVPDPDRQIEAIVGVSCLSVLERAFPYMEAAAIPGVPFHCSRNDCIDTTVTSIGSGITSVSPPTQKRAV